MPSTWVLGIICPNSHLQTSRDASVAPATWCLGFSVVYKTRPCSYARVTTWVTFSETATDVVLLYTHPSCGSSSPIQNMLQHSTTNAHGAIRFVFHSFRSQLLYCKTLPRPSLFAYRLLMFLLHGDPFALWSRLVRVAPRWCRWRKIRGVAGER